MSMHANVDFKEAMQMNKIMYFYYQGTYLDNKNT